MNWIWSFSALILLVLLIHSYLSFQKGEMDWISFIVAKGSKLVIYQLYPLNTTEDVLWSRDFMAKASSGHSGKQTKTALGQIKVKEFEIPVAQGQFLIPAKLFQFSGQKNQKTALYFHGGGWIIGSIAESEEIIFQLMLSTGMNVLSANYRLAPEHPFPAAVNDAYDVLTWLLHNSSQFNINLNDGIVIAGESAGGNLAAAITSHYLLNKIKTLCGLEEENLCPAITQAEASKARWHEISGVWLMYPVLNATSSSPEAKAFSHCNGILSLQQMEWFRRLYQGSNETNESIRSNYLFSPLNSPERIFAVYPPTILTLPKFDVLTAESMIFAQKLETYHRSVSVQFYPRTIHGFVSFHPILASLAIKDAATAMKQLFVH